MPEFASMLVKDAIAKAYCASISPLWEFNYKDSGKDRAVEKIRKYCPSCKTFNSLVETGATATELREDPDLTRYTCRSCGHACNTPAALKPQGANTGSSRSGGDHGNGLVNAMECSVVMDLVESRPIDERNWLLWVYTDPDVVSADHLEGMLLAEFVRRLDQVECEALSGLEQHANVLRLLRLQMLDFRLARRKDVPAGFRIAVYCAAVGRDRSQFRADRLWGRLMRAILADMDAFDNDIITDIGMQFYDAVYRDDELI